MSSSDKTICQEVCVYYNHYGARYVHSMTQALKEAVVKAQFY